MKKLFFDFLPVIIFFGVYKFTGSIVTATAVLIPTTILQIGIVWWKKRKVETVHLVTLVMVIILGGATVLSDNIVFIQWKPTVVYWIFATVFLGSEFIGSKNLIERMSGKQLTLPKIIWSRLNYAWIVFFILLGFVNIFVAFSGRFSEEAWVNFKLFGMLGLLFVFIILQSIYLSRHVSTSTKNNFK